MTVEADARVRALWPELPARIHEAFDARTDVDACARVRLTMADSSPSVEFGIEVIIEVILPDGRAASRATWRDDVLSALQALLLVPDLGARAEVPVPGEAPDPASDPSRPRSVVAPRAPALRESASLAPSTLTPDPWRLRIEFSVVIGTRMGSGQPSVGLGVMSFLDLGGWLLGFEGRFDRYRPVGAEAGIALSMAPLVGRRFRVGTVALDLTAGPAVALQGSTTFEMPAATPGDPPVRWTNATAVPRLLVGSRVNFRAGSVLRSFAGLDADIGLTHEPLAPLPLHAPRLPAWSIGLVLGATVGTL